MLQNNLFGQKLAMTKGVRLQRFGVLNWGGYTGWHECTPKSGNMVLWGESGSGKTTMIDAIQAVFVSKGRVRFNEAGSDVAGDRSFDSYYGGLIGTDNAMKPRLLREGNGHISVAFTEMASEIVDRDRYTALAIVLYASNSEDGRVNHFYIIANRPLTQGDFENFGTSISQLKSRFKSSDGVQLFDDYSKYFPVASQRCGFNQQSIKIFQKLVGQKRADNITTLIRELGLPNASLAEKFEELAVTQKKHEDSLRNVEKNIRRCQLLEPLAKIFLEFSEENKKLCSFNALSDNVTYWIDCKALELFANEETNAREKLKVLQAEFEEKKAAKEYADDQIKKFDNAINQKGGSRIKQIEEEKKALSREQKRRFDNVNRLKANAKSAGINIVNGISKPEDLEHLKQEANESLNEVNERLDTLETRMNKLAVDIKDNEKYRDDMLNEYTTLRKQKTKIGAKHARLREKLATALKIDMSLLPFAGEIIRVKDDEASQRWNGAIERMLHEFASHILVPTEYYDKVIAWVAENNLSSKITIVRIGPAPQMVFRQKDTILEHIMVKPDSQHREWMEKYLDDKFQLRCCETLEDFMKQNLNKAIMPNGLLKRDGVIHEKDDSEDIGSVTYSLLGWTNQEKLSKIEKNLLDVNDRLNIFGHEQNKLDNEKKDKQDKSKSLLLLSDKCSNFTFLDLDFASINQIIQSLDEELQSLLSADNELAQLKKKRSDWESKSKSLEKEAYKLNSECGAEENKIAVFEAKVHEHKLNVDKAETQRAHICDKRHFHRLEKLAEQLCEEIHGALDTPNLGKYERTMKSHFENEIGGVSNRISNMKAQYNKLVTVLFSEFAEYQGDHDSEIANGKAFVDEYNKWKADGLDESWEKIQSGFFDECTHGLLGVVNVERRQKMNDILSKIEAINATLKNLAPDGRYLQIACEETKDSEIRAFRNEMSSVVKNVANDDKAQVVERICKFVRKVACHGEEFSPEKHRKWSAKVADVRNWFEFYIEERDTETGEQTNRYLANLTGKSGGQRERLYAVVLVACIASQLGLTGAHPAPHTFRLCLIDEAFFRGSDAPVRYILDLFRIVGLQLVIVTPTPRPWFVDYFSKFVWVYAMDDYSWLKEMTVNEICEKLPEGSRDAA